MSQASGPVSSSTPHPRRIRSVKELPSLFLHSIISPIAPPIPAKSGAERPCPKANKHVSPKKKRRVPKQKEPTSQAVLKELGATKPNAANMFSISRNLYHLYPEPIILDSDEEEEIFTSRNVVKKTSEKNTPRNKGSKKQEVEDSSKNKKSARSKSAKCGGKRQPQLQSSEPGPSVEIVDVSDNDDDEESLLSVNIPSSNLCDSMKIKNLSILTMVNDIKKDTIKWTPRSKNVKNKIDDDNDTGSVECETKDNENLGGNPTIQSTCVKDSLPRKVKNKPLPQTSSEDPKTKSHKDNFSEECFSRFENVVFKHNKNCGGIVAKCLKTSKVNFGYMEIESGKNFKSHQYADITFVVLEGEVEATVQDASQTMVPGDMLHITSESTYHFVNHGPDHARLLFVRERS